MGRVGRTSTLLAAVCFPACFAERPPPAVEDFLAAYNAHDWSVAATYLAEDVTFEGPDHGPIAGVERVAARLAWDARLGTVLIVDGWEHRGDTARAGPMLERSDALGLMGVDEVHHEAGSVLVVEAGRVVHIRVSPREPASEAAVREAMEAFVPWARHEYRQRLERILPGDEFDYQERRAADWLSLLEEWQNGER